jgi:hypothetical protein
MKGETPQVLGMTLNSGESMGMSVLMVRVLLEGTNRGVSTSKLGSQTGWESLPDLSKFHVIHANQGCHGEIWHDPDKTMFNVELQGAAAVLFAQPPALSIGLIPGGEARAITVYVTKKLDSDNDGLPDEYEALHGPGLGLGDTDGDGYPDYVEMYTGTNPGDQNGKPNVALDLGKMDQPQVTLTIFGAPGVIYTPASSSDMLTWRQLAPAQVGQGEVLSFPIESGAGRPNCYFRFLLEAPPR